MENDRIKAGDVMPSTNWGESPFEVVEVVKGETPLSALRASLPQGERGMGVTFCASDMMHSAALSP